MCKAKWIKLNILLHKISEDENKLEKAKFVGKLVGILVDILFYIIVKRGGTND
jgi:hypothetical protein